MILVRVRLSFWSNGSREWLRRILLYSCGDIAHIELPVTKSKQIIFTCSKKKLNWLQVSSQKKSITKNVIMIDHFRPLCLLVINRKERRRNNQWHRGFRPGFGTVKRVVTIPARQIANPGKTLNKIMTRNILMSDPWGRGAEGRGRRFRAASSSQSSSSSPSSSSTSSSLSSLDSK